MAEKIAFEYNLGRDFTRTAFRVWCPAGTSVRSTDRVLYDGDQYDVFGGAGKWHEFTGEESHVQFIMRLREG